MVERYDSEDRLATIILDSLAKYGREGYDPERAPRYSDEEFARFATEHRAVGITRYVDGRVVITPQTREGHDFVGHREESILLDSSGSAQELLEAVREAFERASD
jgi:hypothetical protein